LYLGRYDRFKAILLLYYPCTWSLTLGAPIIDIIYAKYMGLFFIGSVLMRAAGCIINDMWDKDLDRKVIRTQNRPLANNSVTYKEAVLFLIPHLGFSLAILLQLPLKSIALGLGIMPVVISYPFMKRITYFPQFFLGLSFNSGVLVGYPVLSGVLDLEVCLPLYAAGICWTLIYDTIYAHMDKHDDKLINVKSTALFFGENTKAVCYILCITMFFLIYRVLKRKDSKSIKDNLSIILLLFSILYQFNIVRQTNLNEPLSCLKSFQKSRNFGLLILLSCLIYKINTKTEKI
jgi:4-hydroxybenzoate polyprenyltransferase